MIVKTILSEIKCIAIALAVTFVLVTFFNNNIDLVSGNTVSSNSLFGLSKVLENLVFFVFSTFVVFGVKGFFEKYSQKTANVIIVVTGLLLILAIMVLSYQILFRI